jgi:hypothetical protein
MHAELCSNARAVIPCIHNGMGHRRHGRHLRQHRCKAGTLMTMACRQDKRDTGAFIATARMDCGRQAAPRAAQSLCGVSAVFVNAPAACCWARTIVAAIQRGRVRGQASGWRRSQSWRQSPRRSQRRKRLETASQRPNASGRSRHGVPVRARERTASMHIRSLSTGGLPARDVMAVRMGAISAPASSVSNKRTDRRFPLACIA